MSLLHLINIITIFPGLADIAIVTIMVHPFDAHHGVRVKRCDPWLVFAYFFL